ncbi:NAD(P)/FAD-dependent oxidoreductase [Nonomuraea polychroma]|uniref:NAD(P)/FAD-dependent oxidoreductase n=1 Tax=Nonomuraea polychroma TaxID=46176 RepID=UPI003D8BFD4D
MSEIVVAGAGPAGLVAALLLGADGHQVTVLERDQARAGGLHRAWELGKRPGVSQFRMPHLLESAGWRILRTHLPDVVIPLRHAGAVAVNRSGGTWRVPSDTSRWPDGEFDTVAVRRPVLEAALAAVAQEAPGVSLRQGVGVAGLVADRATGGRALRIRGVVTPQGDSIHADLVIDATGRRGEVSRMLREHGVHIAEERASAGFAFHSRHFAGPMPGQSAWEVRHHDSLSTMVLPGDVGTWSVVLAAPDHDHRLRGLRRNDVWQGAAALFPHVAAWAEGIPISDVLTMKDSRSSRRSLMADGRPVATGLIAIGDAWGTTNPLFVGGLSMAFAHAVVLRNAVGAAAVDDEQVALRFHEAVQTTLAPVYERLTGWDRHRLALLDGVRRRRSHEGTPHEGGSGASAPYVTPEADTAGLVAAGPSRAELLAAMA